MKTKKPLLVTNADRTELYVPIKASGIHPLVVLGDGLSVTFFGKGRTGYLTIQQVIAWHEKELRETRGSSGSRETLEAAREILAKFERGEIVEA